MSPDNENKKEGIPIFELWSKYEEIAMHFNDLIVKIRTQALGAVAAITTIAGILSKGNDIGSYNWGLISSVFFFLIVFWLAIWILDFKYYNRLLHGAVDAIIKLEALSKSGVTHVKEIDLSTCIENAVADEGVQRSDARHAKISFGRKWFYQLVLLALSFGFLYSVYNRFCA